MIKIFLLYFSYFTLLNCYSQSDSVFLKSVKYKKEFNFFDTSHFKWEGLSFKIDINKQKNVFANYKEMESTYQNITEKLFNLYSTDDLILSYNGPKRPLDFYGINFDGLMIRLSKSQLSPIIGEEFAFYSECESSSKASEIFNNILKSIFDVNTLSTIQINKLNEKEIKEFLIYNMTNDGLLQIGFNGNIVFLKLTNISKTSEKSISLIYYKSKIKPLFREIDNCYCFRGIKFGELKSVIDKKVPLKYIDEVNTNTLYTNSPTYINWLSQKFDYAIFKFTNKMQFSDISLFSTNQNKSVNDDILQNLVDQFGPPSTEKSNDISLKVYLWSGDNVNVKATIDNGLLINISSKKLKSEKLIPY